MYSDKRYDVFVAGAADDVEAREIANMLRRKNYNVYFPAERHDPNRVDNTMLAAISKCEDFVVVLGSGAIQSLKVAASPLSQELRRAMQRSRNVIPVAVKSTGAGFAQLGKTPGLPDETSDFAALPSVDASALTTRLTSRVRWNRKLTVLAAFAAAAAVIVGAFLLHGTFAGFPRNAAEREAASRLLEAVEGSVCAVCGGAPGNSVRALGKAEAMEFVRSLEGSGVDLVALAGVLAAPEARRMEGGGGRKETLAENVEKVLSAVHGDEAEECKNRIRKMLEGMK